VYVCSQPCDGWVAGVSCPVSSPAPEDRQARPLAAGLRHPAGRAVAGELRGGLWCGDVVKVHAVVLRRGMRAETSRVGCLAE
jgi:hypothetical protein